MGQQHSSSNNVTPEGDLVVTLQEFVCGRHDVVVAGFGSGVHHQMSHSVRAHGTWATGKEMKGFVLRGAWTKSELKTALEEATGIDDGTLECYVLSTSGDWSSATGDLLKGDGWRGHDALKNHSDLQSHPHFIGYLSRKAVE